MALSSITTNLVVKKWSSDFFKYGLGKMYFSKFVGSWGKAFDPAMGDKRDVVLSDPNAIVQVKMDLSRGIGDTITFPMLAPLSGLGRVQKATAYQGGSGQNTVRTLENYEEAFNQYSWPVTLLEWAHAVRTIGKLMERQPAFSVSDSMTANLGLWWARVLDLATYNAMAGISMVDDGGTVKIITGTAPSTGRKLVGGCKAGTVTFRTTDAALDAAEYMCFEMVDEARRKAMSELLPDNTTPCPTIRPVIAGGREMYYMFLHPKQVRDLRYDAGGSVNITWKEAQMNAAARGAENLIFRNALGIYNDVALFEYPRVASRTGSSGAVSLVTNTFDDTDQFTSGVTGYRALFCGAGAAVHAYGSMPDFVDETFEYKTQKGRCLQTIIAIDRPEFNSIDYGVMSVDTAAST